MSRDKLKTSPPPPPSHPGLIILIFGVLGIVHLALSFVPGINTWGIDYWSSFPAVVRAGLLAALVLAFIPIVVRSFNKAADSLVKPWWGGVLCLATLAVLFVVFRAKAYVYGDGFSFAGYFVQGKFPSLSGQLSTQALDLVAHWAVYRAIVMPLGGTVETSYAILGPLAGILGVWAMVRIARALGAGLEFRRFVVAAGLSSVAITLWFGYVESYSLVNAGILWMIAFAMEAQGNRRRIWLAWGVWIVSVGFHQLALMVSPALVWAHWRAYHTTIKAQSAVRRIGVFAIGFVAWMAASSVYGLLKPDVFVPLLPTANSTYTAFCWDHLRDVINLVIFLAPVGLIGLVVWALARGEASDEKRAAHGIIAVSAASMWFFAFWVDPLLGAFRDWDLLAGFGIPLSLWGGSVIGHRYHQKGPTASLWVLAGVFAIIHAGAFVATLQDSKKAMMRVDRLVREEIHYSSNFFHGKRLGPWAAVVQTMYSRNDLAIEHLRRRVEYEPTDGQAWGNLGGAYRLGNMIDSARVCFQHAVAADPGFLKYHFQLGMTLFDQKDYAGASEQFRQGAALSDTAYDCRCLLGVCYLRLMRAEEAGAVFDDAVRRYPERFDAYYYRGAQREMTADTAGAIRDYETSIAKGGRVTEVFARLCQIYQWSATPWKAVETARLWGKSYPRSNEAPFMEGTSLLVLKKYDSAAYALTRSLTLKPTDAVATYYLATAYRNLNQPSRAKDLAIAASKLDTALALPYLELVYLAADAGDRNAAKAATREYLRRSPKDSTMSYLRQFLVP